MNILLFDLENGSKTLGGRDLIQKKFNFPVLSPASFDEFQNTIVQLFEVSQEEVIVDVGGVKIKENRLKTTTKDNLVIDAVVIDTFSELSKKYQRSLLNKDGVMQLQSWGKLKNKLDGLLEYLVRIPGIVICNCHGKIQTMDSGDNKILPYIDGSTKEDVSKWFDFVLYTKTVNYPDGSNKYMWQVNHTALYDHAKDRTQLLDAEIPQDYNSIIKAAKEKGFDGAKILVIGSPGTGKTYSLNTLVKTTKKSKEIIPKTKTNSVQPNGATSINT